MPETIISFPFMHPELAGLIGWPEALYFDPGLASAAAPGRFRPLGLPLAPAAAAGAVGQLISFGDAFKDTRGLVDFAAATQTAFAPGSSMAIRKELEGRSDPAKAAAAKAEEQSHRAQTLLGLAYAIEENALDLKAIDSRIGSSFARFQKELGLAALDASIDYENCGCGDEEEFDLPGAPRVADEPQTPPWRLVLEAMLFFLPQDAALLTADPDIAGAWDEFNARLAPPAPEALKPWFPGREKAEGLAVGRAPGYALISRTTPDPEKPWLDAHRTVFFITRGD
jgi:hypothetical protein